MTPESIINAVYLAVCVVYAIPVGAVIWFEAAEVSGLRHGMPKWTEDESWKGFITSPYRMWRK